MKTGSAIIVEGQHPDGRWDSDPPPPVGWGVPTRYRLNGRELHPGELVELELADGTWVCGRFCEPTTSNHWFDLALQLAGQDDEELLRVTTDASFRWPRRAA